MERQIEVVLFELFNNYIRIIKDELRVPYLDAFFMMSQDILRGDANDEIGTNKREELVALLEEMQEYDFKKEELRKALVATTLNGYKVDNIQNSEITPDTISLLIGYLASHLTKNKEKLAILDPVVGTASMLTAVANMLNREVDLVGIDSNLDNINIGRIFGDLQQYSIDFLLEDTIESGMVGFDLIVADIPLYIYDDEYFPHRLVDKWIDGLNDDGWMIAVIPNDFFEVEGAFKEKIIAKATLQGIIQLPGDMFVDPKLAKSILIARKKVESNEDFLMIELPSLKEHEEFARTIRSIDNWFKEKGDLL